MSAFEQIIDKLERVKLLHDRDAVASCPVSSHGQGRGDKNPSLHVTDREGKVLIASQSTRSKPCYGSPVRRSSTSMRWSWHGDAHTSMLAYLEGSTPPLLLG